jgi:hypothetical protein
MTSRISKLVLAAVLAGSIPAAASADHDDGRPSSAYPAPPQHVPPAAGGWREQRWRERELATIHAELQRLEAERAQFHARYAGRPGKLRRYERDYVERRAELERRMSALHRLAWR